MRNPSACSNDYVKNTMQFLTFWSVHLDCPCFEALNHHVASLASFNTPFYLYTHCSASLYDAHRQLSASFHCAYTHEIRGPAASFVLYRHGQLPTPLFLLLAPLLKPHPPPSITSPPPFLCSSYPSSQLNSFQSLQTLFSPLISIKQSTEHSHSCTSPAWGSRRCASACPRRTPSTGGSPRARAGA